MFNQSIGDSMEKTLKREPDLWRAPSWREGEMLLMLTRLIPSQVKEVVSSNLGRDSLIMHLVKINELRVNRLDS